MKKVIIFILVFSFFSFVNIHASDNDFFEWKGMDIVVIFGDVYEYNLYRSENNRIDDAIDEILEYFWEVEASLYNANFSVNRGYVLENNTSLSNGVRRMMQNRNANISTTKYFTVEDGRVVLRFTVNWTSDFITYSIIHTWDEVRAWSHEN